MDPVFRKGSARDWFNWLIRYDRKRLFPFLTESLIRGCDEAAREYDKGVSERHGRDRLRYIMARAEAVFWWGYGDQLQQKREDFKRAYDKMIDPRR